MDSNVKNVTVERMGTMNISIKGRNTEVTNALKDYVEKRFSKLEKYFYKEMTGTVTLVVEKGDHRAEATIPLGRYILRAEESSNDMYASIDAIVDKIERQIRKYKTRLAKRLHNEELTTLLAQEDMDDEVDDINIIRSKKFTIKPMSPEEAVLQMNLTGHTFFVFRNADNHDAIAVVYARNNGGYGLIEDSAD